MANICEDCGCKVYNGACVNCHEEIYIADQHLELGTYGEVSEEFKRKVEHQYGEVAKKLSTGKP